MNLVDIFKQLGAAVRTLAGNEPLLLTENSDIWIVEEGAVDFFVVELEDGKPVGNLNPLMRYSQGAIFFGFEQGVEANEIGIIIRGTPGTIIHSLLPQEFYPKIENQDILESFAQSASNWVSGCMDSITVKVLKKEVEMIGKRLTEEQALVRLLQKQKLGTSLNEFHRIFLSILTRQFDIHLQHLHDHLQQRDDAAKAVVARGMQRLAAILSTGKKRPFITTDDVDPLFVVCREIGNSLNVHIRQPPRPEDEEDAGRARDRA